MSDPINLNQSSPGALNTGAPPVTQVALDQPAAGAAAPQTNILPPPCGGTIVVVGGGGGATAFNVVRVTTPQGNIYNADFNDLVAADPTNGAFTIALPPGSSLTPGGPNAVIVEVQSDSNNGVTLTPNGNDTIGGVAGVSAPLMARESIYLVFDGVSDWMVIQ